MAVSFGCHCEERRKPVEKRNWTVYQRHCNHSAFNGYHWTPSDYSLIRCERCGRLWRTKARYVVRLPDGKLPGVKS